MMQWKINQPESLFTSERRIWYSSSYIVTQVDLRQFGQVWGKGTIGFRLHFSIHPRISIDKHAKRFPFQLLITDEKMPNGHIYIKTVAEGKRIAEKIVEGVKKSWRNTRNPWKLKGNRCEVSKTRKHEWVKDDGSLDGVEKIVCEHCGLVKR